MKFNEKLHVPEVDLKKIDSKARNDEQFLREAELRGMEEPNMKGRKRPSIINNDLLPHDVAEDWGIDKDEDPEGIVYKEDDYSNVRFIPGNDQNDIGEPFDDEDLDIEEDTDGNAEILEEVRLEQQRKDHPINKINGKYSGMKFVKNNSRSVWSG